MNSLTLAYIGDSVYDLYIRKYLINTGITKVKKLQEESIKYVSAKNQANYLKSMIDANFFSEDEIHIITTARNHKNNHRPKNCDIITYKHATALEAIIGFHYLNNNIKRIEEIINFILRR